MNRHKIFVNLPVKDLGKSIAFFTKLGFTFDARFTDQNSTCMIIDEHINVMLLVEKFFKTFTKKEIPDLRQYQESIVAISTTSKEEVNDIVEKAVAAGGKRANDYDDQGWMYGGSFHDLDDAWEFFYMDVSQMKENVITL